MPLIAIPIGIAVLFLIGIGLYKCGDWLETTISDTKKNDE